MTNMANDDGGNGQRQLVLSLSDVFRTAETSVIPKAHFELQRGLHLERKRLRGRPWLVLLRRDEIEFDGSRYDRVELVQTFHQTEEAKAAAWNRLCEVYFEDIKPELGNGRWTLVAKGPEVEPLTLPTPPPGGKQPVYRYGYKLANSSGLHIRYAVAHVVPVNPERVIDDALFDFLDAEWELISYLCEKGEVRDRPPSAQS